MIKEKVAVVTGAARGIGHGIAKKLADDGCAIAIFDILNFDDVKDNIDEIKEKNIPVLYFQGDLTNNQDRNQFVTKIMEEYGRVDFLINNAGVAPKSRKDILETTEESYDFVMDINLKGTFFFTQKIANIMIEEKENNDLDIEAKIVNIASTSSYTSSPNRGEYCISKAGISMITKLYADRLAEYGINVYEVRPGIIYTDMTSVVKDKYDKLIEEGITPIKRWGHPEDIAKAVSVFCSGMLDFSTAEVINVDGGFHLRRL